MITAQDIHYVKSSLRRYTGETPRLSVNMDVVGVSSNKIHKLQWKMTQELRELRNSLEGDSDWPYYDLAQQQWRDIRSSQGHSVKLWIGKLHERTRYIPGKVQSNTRIECAVSLMVLHRKSGDLSQYIWWDEWQHEQKFHTLEHKDYNRVWDWRNPLSSKLDTPQTKRIKL